MFPHTGNTYTERTYYNMDAGTVKLNLHFARIWAFYLLSGMRGIFMNRTYTKAITHGGKFHADDVFSSALLYILFPGIEITRGYIIPTDFDGIVFDIGNGRFDHHQTNAPVRENGVPYAAFGLLWREFGESLLGDDAAKKFDESFVQPIDLDDNTGCGCQLASVISSFNPNWDSSETFDQCFERAVDMAKVILEHQFDTILSRKHAADYVREAYNNSEDKRIVFLPKFAPWKESLAGLETKFVIFPSLRGGFNVQAVPDTQTRQPKCLFPAAWAGEPSWDLPRISGVPSMSFCHNGRFLVTVSKIEDAYLACQIAMRSSLHRTPAV